MGRLNIVEDDDNDRSVKSDRSNTNQPKQVNKEQLDIARKKCISDESGYFEGAEDMLPGESGSIEILFEKSGPGNNNLKPRILVPSPAISPVTANSSSKAVAQKINRPELMPSTSKGKF